MSDEPKFKVGSVWRTRGGWKARVICNNAPADFPVISFKDDGEPCDQVVISHHAYDGRCALSCDQLDDLLTHWPNHPELPTGAVWPTWARACAMDGDSRWYWFASIPELYDKHGGWIPGNGDQHSVEMHPSETPTWTGDWRESLVVREEGE